MTAALRVAPGTIVGVRWSIGGVGERPHDAIDRNPANGFFQAGQPLRFLVGRNQLAWGLEHKLLGLAIGDVVHDERSLPPRDPKLVFDVRVERLPVRQRADVWLYLQKPEGEPIAPGMFIVLPPQTVASAPLVLVVAAVKDGVATLDANHPLAGRSIRMEVEIEEIRPADPDELRHAITGPFVATPTMLRQLDLESLDFSAGWISARSPILARAHHA